MNRSPDDNKSILIAITNPAFALRQINWVNSLEGTSWRPITLCLFPAKDILRILEDKKIKKPSCFIDLNVEQFIFFQYFRRFLALVKKIRVGFIYFFFQVAYNIILTKKNISEVRRLIRINNVTILLGPDSSPSYFAPILAFAAKKERVIFLTNPLDRIGPLNYAMIYKSDKSKMLIGFKRYVVAKIFPKWVIEYQNSQFLRDSLDIVFTQEILGISSSNPWHTFGFVEDIVVLNNQIQQKFYSHIGVCKEKCKLIGCPELDYLVRTPSNSILNKYRDSFFEIKPIILCALPQSHFIEGRIEAEFQSHKEIIDNCVECLSSQSNFNIIISLHPSMAYRDYNYLDCENMKVASEDILDLIPFCSIFVASLSSTIQFAIALGKPVINYDVYRYSLEIEHFRFLEAKGTITVLNKKDLLKEIALITSDSSYYNLLASHQKNSSEEWGLLDGESVYRFINLLDNLYLNKKE
jgi:hypothetical protein